ncbi:MAG: phosphoenolpyruvate--protein phosphotransferase [Burkholderiales bacterium]|nr:phosphoenolpyruvate--protein phosphotransferase [Burkholderiales bacterium]
MSILVHGIGLGGGITIGQAYILDKSLDVVTAYTLEKHELKAEIVRFKEAVAQTKRELELLRINISQDAPPELGAFLSLNILMLDDKQISQAPVDIINKEECNAEWAIKLQADKLYRQFAEMDDDYLKERKHDVRQVFERIFKNLEGNKFDWYESGKLEQGILVTHDLSPADLVHFKNSNFTGFLTEVGSLTSHTVIVGRNLDIPAIVGATYARQLIREDDLIIVDGIQGVLIINPDKTVLNEYKKRQQLWIDSKAKLYAIRNDKTITVDNVEVELYANIDGISDLNEVNYSNAAGIGLYRSEFLFLANVNHLCPEDEQVEAYRRVATTMKERPVVIRTADLGADKNPLWNNNVTPMNPALGLTGIRLSLVEQMFFRTQLRALLRASHFGNIQILFPMISSSWELKQALNQLQYAKNELIDEGVSFDSEIKVGVMIEVPSAALALKGILAQVDFISIGTNDLLQYLLAMDRNDESVSYLYNPLHPAMLKVLMLIIKNCNRYGVPVSICGEMASDPNLTRLLLGMGLRKFSMHCANILSIKSVILNTNLGRAATIVSKIIKTEDPEQINELIDELNFDLFSAKLI